MSRYTVAGLFYEKKTGKIPSRLIIVTPYANENAIILPKNLI